MRRLVAIAVALAIPCLSLPPAPARAEAPEPRYDLTLDLSVTASALALMLISETALKSTLIPEQCRWCSTNSLDNSVRSALRWNKPALADGLSYATLLLASAGAWTGWGEALDSGAPSPGADLLIVAESVALASVLTEVFKASFARARPLTVDPALDYGDSRWDRQDRNASFISGHTTMAFALATSAGAVAHMRGYRLEPLVWTLGGVGAVATGLLRISADQHWFTDVLAGAAVGTAVGLGVSALHRPKQAKEGALAPRMGLSSNLLVLRWAF